MKDILIRFLSPVVIVQIIITIAGVIIYFMPGQSEAIQVIVAAIVAIVNLFAGINDPTNRIGF